MAACVADKHPKESGCAMCHGPLCCCILKVVWLLAACTVGSLRA
jgi:hypothetical protein